MKYIDMIHLRNGLTGCAGLKGVKFAYAVAKNIRMITQIMDDLENTVKEDDDFKAYNKARIKLCESLAEVDDKTGKPKIAGNSYVFKDQDEFDGALKELKESDAHKEAVTRHEGKQAEYRKLVEEGESEYVPFKVALASVPVDITGNQAGLIYEIIQE